jgi:tetratricopeptide (TPR) repeat protein
MERKVKSVALLRTAGVSCLVMVFLISCLGQQTVLRQSGRQTALALEQEGRFAEAEAAWRSVLSRQPNDWEAYAHLGLLEARQEHYKEAIPLYRKALSLNPNVPNLHVNLGLSLFKAGDLKGAVSSFESALKSEPQSSPEELRLVTLIGLAHYGLGEYAAAIPYLRKAANADQGNLPLRMALAQSCLWSKQYQCVLDVYREILKINPDSAEADVLAGEAYDELKNDGGALQEFQAAVKADPKLPNVHFGYGYLFWKGQKLRQAEEQFRAELANDPDHSMSLAYLGDTEIKLNHPDQALPYLEHAIQIQPNLALAHLDLGIVYQGQGRKEDALRELQTAEKLSPDDPAVHWQLGRCYQSMGRRAEARTEFEKTQHLQNATEQSLREKMRQAEPQPAARSDGPATK